MSPNDMSVFIDIIKGIVRDEINNNKTNSARKSPTFIPATVVSTTATTATVTLGGEESTNITLRFAQGLSLSASDDVIVCTVRGSLTNAFVGFKLT